MIEIETSHLIGVAIALLSFIVGRTELLNKCLRQIKTDLEVHIAIAEKQNEYFKQAINKKADKI